MPISRPSITTGCSLPIRRCSSRKALRTPGAIETFEAAFDTSGSRIAAVTSSPFSRTFESPSNSMRGLARQLLQAVQIVEIDIRPERPQRHRAKHRSGVDVGKSELPRQGTRDGAFPRARRPVDGND